MVDAMNHDNSKQLTTHDLKKLKIHIVTIESKYSNKINETSL